MKKFSKYIEEMSMSVTLQRRKNNMYKVTGVGDKMKAHGGIKKGEKFHDRDIDGMHDSGIKVKYDKPKPMKKEAIERRADRKTIIATDPATGRKVVKIAPKKEIDIGKGKMESVVNEISDKLKINYIKKANKKISDKEHMRDYQNKQMDKKPDSFTKADKDFVNKKYDKDTEKRRKGVRMAASKLGEESVNELKISTMQNYKRKAYKDVQDGENARHKGYPEKEIDKQQDKRYKGIDTANKRIAKKQVKMAKGVAFDKRYKGGNMTGASKAIDKIKPGLSNHPKVKDALRRANEEFKGE